MADGHDVVSEIRAELFRQQDLTYRALQRRIIPTVDPETVVGVRTPALRQMAKSLAKRADIGAFLDDLPHAWFEENQLHAFLIAGMRDYAACVREVSRFLPFVDNWATCDQMLPRVFGQHTQELTEPIRAWIASGQTYAVRFGIGMLMAHYLGEDFDPAWPEMVAGIRSEEYYVNMMIAWYFATALAKRYEETLPFIEGRRLAPWTHNKAIQKAIESYRFTPEQKAYLRTLKTGRRA